MKEVALVMQGTQKSLVLFEVSHHTITDSITFSTAVLAVSVLSQLGVILAMVLMLAYT